VYLPAPKFASRISLDQIQVYIKEYASVGRLSMSGINAANRPSSLAEALLKEGVMRHKSEMASAIAALQMTKAKFCGPHPLLDGAIARLSDQLELEELLSSSRANSLTEGCANLLWLLASSRAKHVKLELQVAQVRAEPELNIVRTIMLVTYHLTVDALNRHRDCAAPITVSLTSSPRRAVVAVGTVIGHQDSALLPGDPTYETVSALALVQRGNVLVRRKGSFYEVRISFPLGHQSHYLDKR
jgi:hypothetical protein